MKIDTEIHIHINDCHSSVLREQPDTLHMIIELMYVKGLEDCLGHSEVEVNKLLDAAYVALKQMPNIPAGLGFWRMTKRYIHALEWVLEVE